MYFATAFPLLLATLAFVPASVLARPFDNAGNSLELQARMGGAESSHYARRSPEDIELPTRSLDVDELLAVRDVANLHWFDAREFGELEARMLSRLRRGRNSRPSPAPSPAPSGGAPAYSFHDPKNGPKPEYHWNDPHPPPSYRA